MKLCPKCGLEMHLSPDGKIWKCGQVQILEEFEKVSAFCKSQKVSVVFYIDGTYKQVGGTGRI
jgi:hypothetical protein